MKKSILVLMSAMALAATAQTVNRTPAIQKFDASEMNDVMQARQSAAGAESRWLNWASQAHYLEYGDNTISDFDVIGVTTAPDSLMLYGEDNHVWVHALGQVLQPTHEDFEWLDDNNSYTVDSVSVDYVYTRNLTDNSIVDTLEIVVLSNPGAAGGITWTDNNASYLPYTANADINKFGNNGSYAVETIKVPLNSDDTTSFISSIEVGFPAINYTAAEYVGAMVRFIPGYSYNLSDTIFDQNYLTLITFEEADGAEPVYIEEDNYNKSYIMDPSVRYQTNSGGQAFLNNTLLPTAIYTAPFAYEHHSIWFKVSSPNVGVEDFNAIGATMYPNPTEGVIKIDTDVEQTEVEIFNMLGQEVVSVVETGNFSIDITDQKPGIYFVTIKNEQGTATSKIVKK